MKKIRLSVDLNQGGGLARCIAEQVRNQILGGALPPGSVLPSIRSLSRDLSVSNDTVIAAYRDLAEQGLLQARRGSGFTVLEPPPARPGAERRRADRIACPVRPLGKAARFCEERLAFFRPYNYESRPFIAYGSGLAGRLRRDWLRLSAAAARTPWRHADYSDPAGYMPLRRAVAERLLQFRGIRCSPESIIITSGTLQSLNLLFRVLTAPGSTLAVESPAPSLVSQTAEFCGLKTAFVPTDGRGFNAEALMRLPQTPSAVFAETANSTPMSTATAPERRAALLSWAARTGGWIIEDDMENLAWHGCLPLRPVRAEPGAERCTAYIDSFTLQFFPGIKTGYIVAPEGFEKALAGARLLTDRSNPEQTQSILAAYLMSDAYEDHMRRLEKRFRRNYECIDALVRSELADFGEPSHTLCGSHIAFFLREIPDAQAAEALRRRGIVTRAVSSFRSGGAAPGGLMLGFGSFSEEEIASGIAVIKEVLSGLASERGA